MKLPLATLALVAANVLAYRYELSHGGLSVCATYGLVPAHLELTSFVTNLFLHDPSNLIHIGGNMLFLALFGTIVEQSFGSLRLIAIYMAAGIGGALLHIQVDPSSTAALVGASGAIAGLMAVAAVLRPRLLGFVVSFIGLNVWWALAGTGGTVSFAGHIGGFVVGLVVVALARAAGDEAMEAA